MHMHISMQMSIYISMYMNKYKHLIMCIYLPICMCICMYMYLLVTVCTFSKDSKIQKDLDRSSSLRGLLEQMYSAGPCRFSQRLSTTRSSDRSAPCITNQRAGAQGKDPAHKRRSPWALVCSLTICLLSLGSRTRKVSGFAFQHIRLRCVSSSPKGKANPTHRVYR